MILPRITVVTPSFNQADVLEQTIESVLGQRYPNLEYLVLDGGSTDGSAAIIDRHAEHLAYSVSEPDGGQAAAINAGFRRSTGDILAWLNSDDLYLPGALALVASRLDPTRPQLLFGNAVHLVEERAGAFGGDVLAEHRARDLALTDYLVQPSTFWTRKAWEATGPLDESLHWGFDWDWYIRALRAGVDFRGEGRFMSVYRIRSQQKTTSGGEARVRELESILATHAGPRFAQLLARCCSRRRRILTMRRWIRRLRLLTHEGRIFKLTGPLLFRGFTSDEVGDIVTVVPAQP